MSSKWCATDAVEAPLPDDYRPSPAETKTGRAHTGPLYDGVLANDEDLDTESFLDTDASGEDATTDVHPLGKLTHELRHTGRVGPLARIGDMKPDVMNTLQDVSNYCTNFKQALGVGDAPDLPFPLFVPDMHHNLTFSATFDAYTEDKPDPRVSDLIPTSVKSKPNAPNFTPILLRTDMEQVKKTLGNHFKRVVPLEVRVKCVDSAITAPWLVSLVSKDEEGNLRNWSRVDTVTCASASQSSVGGGLYVPGPKAITKRSDDLLFMGKLGKISKPNFRRWMHANIPEMKAILHNRRSADNCYYLVDVPSGESKQVNELAWLCMRNLHEVIKKLGNKFGDDYGNKEMFAPEAEGGQLRMPVPIADVLLDNVQQIQEKNKTQLILDDNVQVYLTPVLPKGWASVQSDMHASKGVIDMLPLYDPPARTSVTLTFTVLPVWVQDKAVVRAQLANHPKWGGCM